MDDGILGGLKDILFGSTGPRGGKRDGVVQTMAKSAARRDESDCAWDVGEFAGGESGKFCAVCLCLMRRLSHQVYNDTTVGRIRRPLAPHPLYLEQQRQTTDNHTRHRHHRPRQP